MLNPKWYSEEKFKEHKERKEDLLAFEKNPVPWLSYLFNEATARTHERKELINISDGGFSGDNGALLPLFERRCRIIIAGDASGDKEGRFDDLLYALQQAKDDFGIKVEIIVDQLVAKEEKKDGKTIRGLSKGHFAVGKITYPRDPNPENEKDETTGWLIYFKPAVTDSDLDFLKRYKAANPVTFPHPATADFWVEERQYEALRLMGETSVNDLVLKIKDNIKGEKEKEIIQNWLSEETLKKVWRSFKPKKEEI